MAEAVEFSGFLVGLILMVGYYGLQACHAVEMMKANNTVNLTTIHRK